MNDPATSGRVPGHLLIPSLFRVRAARTPDAPAVIGARGEVLSYAELAARADRFAAGLRRAGVRE
ncbi:AMP-binding protein, partial [Streptomyces sp. NEAU-H3]|uniref:AMP-binding protein n=1 Tax=Streptomyces sp. NEAU-H3 TaxID=2720636 RepID=UPI00143AD132